MNKINQYISYPIRALNSVGLLKWIPDHTYLSWRYKVATGKKLNLYKPETYNEKLQWLKLNNRKKLYTKLVDKFEVREFISMKIGADYLVPLHGVWNSVEEIDWNKLPSKYVIKCTHDSGGLIICKDKNKIDVNKSIKKIHKSMSNNYYYAGREWPYKNVKPRIICEYYLEDSQNTEIQNYRVFCFHGKPTFIAVDLNTIDKKNTRRNIYDLDWKLQDFEISYPREERYEVTKPKKLEEIIDLSKVLSENLPHARVDFYYVDEKIYFGEITFFHQSGLGEIKPEAYEKKIGDLIDLSNIQK